VLWHAPSIASFLLLLSYSIKRGASVWLRVKGFCWPPVTHTQVHPRTLMMITFDWEETDMSTVCVDVSMWSWLWVLCHCRYTLQYQESIPCEQLVMRLCDLKQAYTQFGGMRCTYTICFPQIWGNVIPGHILNTYSFWNWQFLKRVCMYYRYNSFPNLL